MYLKQTESIKNKMIDKNGVSSKNQIEINTKTNMNSYIISEFDREINNNAFSGFIPSSYTEKKHKNPNFSNSFVTQNGNMKIIDDA